MQFIGLVAEGKSDLAETQAFIDQFSIPWPNGYGAEETIKALGVSAYPTILVVGTDGQIAWNDELDGTLQEAIDRALGGKAK